MSFFGGTTGAILVWVAGKSTFMRLARSASVAADGLE